MSDMSDLTGPDSDWASVRLLSGEPKIIQYYSLVADKSPNASQMNLILNMEYLKHFYDCIQI